MTQHDPAPMVFLFDVDNTLLDNDGAKARIDAAIVRALGAAGAARFWDLYERVRVECDVVDVPETIARFARELDDTPALAALAEGIYGCDFRGLLHPGALEALAFAAEIGVPVLVSDGEESYQRHKIRTAGLEEAVGGRVLIFAHKEQELPEICVRYPARRYVVVDDKPRILAALREALGSRVTTVFVAQGKYARDAEAVAAAAPDLRLDSIAGFVELGRDAFG